MCLYFTIGETCKGRRNGLSTTTAGIIRQRGLELIYVPSGSGRPSLDDVDFYNEEAWAAAEWQQRQGHERPPGLLVDAPWWVQLIVGVLVGLAVLFFFFLFLMGGF